MAHLSLRGGLELGIAYTYVGTEGERLEWP